MNCMCNVVDVETHKNVQALWHKGHFDQASLILDALSFYDGKKKNIYIYNNNN